MISKNQIIDAIQPMPQDEFVNIEPVLEEIILLEKIKTGLNAVEKGKVFSEEEVDKLTEEW